MNWHALTTEAQIDDIIAASHQHPVVIFKHSTRCSISSTAKSRLERTWDIPADTVEAYYLDLLAYRAISNAVATRFAVHHESPQLLLIIAGECPYVESQLGINVAELKEQIAIASAA